MNRSVFASCALLASLAFAAPEGGSAILVLDLQRAIETCDEARDVNNDLVKQKVEVQREIDKERQALAEQVAKLKKRGIEEMDERFFQEIRELNEQMGRLSGRADETNARIGHKIMQKRRGLWLDALKFARQILEEKEASVIFFTRVGGIQFSNEEEVAQEYVYRRAVVAREETADITGEVLRRMNEAYQARKPS